MGAKEKDEAMTLEEVSNKLRQKEEELEMQATEVALLRQNEKLYQETILRLAMKLVETI